jgi:hypothetical protein
MMNLRPAAALLLLGFAPTVARAEPPESAEPLAPFARFVGGAWESEGDFKVRVVYEWGLNKKLIKIKSYLPDADGPKLVYESAVYWHPAKKEVVFQSVSGQGGIFDGVMTVKGNVYSSAFTSYTGDKATPFRQTIEFTDDDHVLWTVLGKKGDEWVTLHSVKEHRVKDKEAATR